MVEISIYFEVYDMKFDIEKTLFISKASQNFSAVTEIAEKHDLITILKNNKPKYALMAFDRFE
jgi:PHD/YefM family antitoxin component YafN of YafNO toxin-antitoxin module